MVTELPRNVMEMWEKGQAAKAYGHKNEAMKHFLGYYDMLNIFQQSLNLQISDDVLAQRVGEVEAEIGAFLQDESYLAITRLPQEGIDEIKAAVGLGAEGHFLVYDQVELLPGPIMAYTTDNRMIKITQFTLVDCRYKNKL